MSKPIHIAREGVELGLFDSAEVRALLDAGFSETDMSGPAGRAQRRRCFGCFIPAGSRIWDLGQARKEALTTFVREFESPSKDAPPLARDNRSPVPEGQDESSPAFQRRVRSGRSLSPEGTAEKGRGTWLRSHSAVPPGHDNTGDVKRVRFPPSRKFEPPYVGCYEVQGMTSTR